jgi:hypothetical protein
VCVRACKGVYAYECQSFTFTSFMMIIRSSLISKLSSMSLSENLNKRERKILCGLIIAANREMTVIATYSSFVFDNKYILDNY